MNELMSHHNVLVELIGTSSVVYVDIPVHDNIGDLLIMHGTFSFFKKNKINVSDVFSAINVDFKKITADSVIVFHGGGNFGDLYHLHQNCREEIVKKYPNNRIIVLPQTIYFKDEDALKKSVSVFASHKDLHICVRDLNSLKLAKGMTPNLYLLPDMAHQLYPIQQSLSDERPVSTQKILYISRVDVEKVDFEAGFSFDRKVDWVDLTTPYSQNIEFHVKYQYRTRHNALLRWLNKVYFVNSWVKFSYLLTEQAIQLLTDYDLIYTDRLHGHILACLLNKPNIVIDNSYGKNSSYVNLWTKKSNLVGQVN
jgi:pyruvyl transferase EpsO